MGSRGALGTHVALANAGGLKTGLFFFSCLFADLSDSTLSYTETEATNSPNVTPGEFSGWQAVVLLGSSGTGGGGGEWRGGVVLRPPCAWHKRGARGAAAQGGCLEMSGLQGPGFALPHPCTFSCILRCAGTTRGGFGAGDQDLDPRGARAVLGG